MILSAKGRSGGGGTGNTTGFSFWPRTLNEELVVPDGHTLPTHELVIDENGEIVIGENAEVLAF